jgi:hypothetical protein
MSPLLWLVVLVLSIAWLLALGRFHCLLVTLGRMSRHWFPMALFGAVCLMAGGAIGTELGIRQLFRDDPVIGFNQNSPAFWGAFGATVLVGEIWTIVYLSDYISSYARLDPEPRPPGWGRPRQWTTLSQDLARFNDPRPMFAFLLVYTPPFLLVLALCAASSAQAGSAVGNARAVWVDGLVLVGGILLGVATFAVVLLLGFGLLWRVQRSRWARGAAAVTSHLLRTAEIAPPPGRPDPHPAESAQTPRPAETAPPPSRPDPRSAIALAFWVFLLVYLLAAVVPLSWSLIVPSLAITVLLGLVLAVYFVLISLRRSVQLVFLVLVVGYTAWSNSSPYKYRFPEMTAADGTSLYDTANLFPAERTEAEGPGPNDPLLDNVAVLQRWKANLKEERPKLVLVSVTGGAYRAGFWTAAVLDELKQRSRPGGALPGLTDHIRIITGASGGMVGAAYFVTLGTEGESSVVDTLVADSRRDSLTPVIQQLVQRDIPMIFCPTGYQRVDRGVKLEDQWGTIARPFHATYADEREGRRPSLIVSPMVVETGERMLISNLDLDDIGTPVSTTGEPYVASARQFYRMFPSTQSTFKLNTAVRLSASFPYASPAVSLPTKPVRRLVDAGYYDNYGVNLAAAWLYEHRDWIFHETSGVALIQIYAYPRTDGAVSNPDAAPARGGIGATLGGDFSWLTSPIEGALGARNWSMLYRNEEQLRLLDDTFNKQPGTPRFFETFIFANPGGAAMNWTVALQDVAEMKNSIAGGQETNETERANNRQMAKLTAWWNSKQYRRRPDRPIAPPDRLQQTQFEESDVLTPYDERRINLTLDRFRAYMRRLGLTPQTDRIKVRISTDRDFLTNAYYEPQTHTLVIGLPIARDRDTIIYTYTTYILHTESKRDDWGDLGGFQSGLADYFSCSFSGDPELGVKFVLQAHKVAPKSFSRPYLRMMNNHRRFDSVAKQPLDPNQPDRFDEGEVWGGAFWELRAAMGRDAQGNRLADILLLGTVQNLKFPPAGADPRTAVVAQIIEQDKQLFQSKYAPKIREVFEKRGVKLPPP